MAKINEAVGMKNGVTMNGRGKRLVCPFIRQQFWKCMGCVISAVTYEKKDTSFGVIYENLLVKWIILNYKEMFLENIYL